jgi:hypothetical protein
MVKNPSHATVPLHLLVDFGLPLSQLFGNLRVVNVGVDLNNLLPLYVGEDHESVHGSLDVVRRVFLRLK